MTGVEVRAARLRAGLSRRALAKKIGVSAETLRKYEAGVCRMRAETILRVAETLEQLLDGKTEIKQCDSFCRRCAFYKPLKTGRGYVEARFCNYLVEVGKRRPCPAGTGCAARKLSAGKTREREMVKEACGVSDCDRG